MSVTAHVCSITITIVTVDRYNSTLSRHTFKQVIYKISSPAAQGMEPVSVKETNRTVQGITFMDVIGIHCKSFGKSTDVLRV
jgi:hypothetical protein